MESPHAEGADLSRALKKDFDAVLPLVLEEWPALDRAAVAKTEGDLDRLVALLAEATSHTKVLLRAKLRELHAVAAARLEEERAAGDPLQRALDRLEKRVVKLAAEARGHAAEALPAVKTFAKDHFLWTLLILLGLGFFLGTSWGPRRGRDVR